MQQSFDVILRKPPPRRPLRRSMSTALKVLAGITVVGMHATSVSLYIMSAPDGS